MDPQSLGGKVPVLELYDLRADPDEMRNLAKVPANRAELDRLYRALRQWVKDTADPAVQPPEMPPLPKAS
jgi:N-sulfoglucosamine sulfohydrolase